MQTDNSEALGHLGQDAPNADDVDEFIDDISNIETVTDEVSTDDKTTHAQAVTAARRKRDGQKAVAAATSGLSISGGGQSKQKDRNTRR